MKIVVCTKQVPDVAELRFDAGTRTIVREGVPSITNPYDRRAFPKAAELRDAHGGEFVAVTMGPPFARDVLLDALACGADRAVHIQDPALAGSDTLATARVLAAFCRREEADLILAGRATTDGDTGQVGPEVAELLGIPCFTSVSHLDIEAGYAVAGCETEDGFVVRRAALPVVVTTGERLARPVKAQIDPDAGPVEVLSLKDLGLQPADAGTQGSPTWVQGIEPLGHHREREHTLTGDPSMIGDALAGIVLQSLAFSGKQASQPHLAAEPAGRDGELWVVCATANGRLWESSVELLTPARVLARPLGAAVVAVMFAPEPEGTTERLTQCGADYVLILDGNGLHDPQARAEALCRLIEERPPAAVLAPSLWEVRDVLPRVAARLRLGMTSDCIGFDLDDERRIVQHKPAFGGSFVAPILSKTSPVLATARAGVFEAAVPNPQRRPQVRRVALHGLPSPTQELSRETTVDPAGAQLESADCVICVGMGIGAPENLAVVEKLAQALDAPIAATRRAVDAGWLPRAAQIGLTGRAIAPKVYIGIGVRGTFNHVVGMHRSATIIAINSDPEAEIFAHATVAAVGDWAQIVPQLTESILQRKR